MSAGRLNFVTVAVLSWTLHRHQSGKACLMPDYIGEHEAAAAVVRQDADDIRKKILSIPYVEWKRRGFSKGTLHHMKKNAERDQPFSLNKHVMTRLDQWDQSVD